MWPGLSKKHQRKRVPHDRAVYSKALPHLPSTCHSPSLEDHEQTTRPQSSRASEYTQQAPPPQLRQDRPLVNEASMPPVGRSRVSSTASRAPGWGISSKQDSYAQRDQRIDLQDHHDIEERRAADVIRKLALELDDAAAKNHSLQQELLGLQEKQFQQMVDPRYAPPEDSVIVQELSEIQQKITKIGKDYVSSHVEGLDKRSEEDLFRLHRELQSVALFHDSVPAMMEELKKSEFLGKVCFTALLSWHVHRGVLKSPFFFMKDRTTTSNWYDIFSDVDKLANAMNVETANAWRSQTLRYFLPDGQSEQALRVRDRTTALRRRASELAARDFLSSSAMSMVFGKDRDEFDALESRVTAIFDQAAEFSMMLWRQKLSLRVSSLSDLAALNFRVDSLEMKAHPLHKLDDPADRSLDGRSIRIMMHPQVASSDTEEGAQTGSRVFIKATVVLEGVT